MGTAQAALRRKIKRMADKLEKYLGTPHPPSIRAKPIDMLIATLLSQNTNDKNSHRAYIQLKKTFPSWSEIAGVPWQKIATSIRTGGMANQKSKRIKKIIRTIEKEYGSIDLDFLYEKSDDEVIEILSSFDGVGIKTAACVLTFSLGRDIFPVDTHVHRICNRLGLTSNCKTPECTFQQMKPNIPKGKGYSFHTNLIRFGRKICKANNPLCNICPAYKECRYEDKEIFAIRRTNRITQKDYEFMLLDNV